MLAATGWRLEELDLNFNPGLGAAGERYADELWEEQGGAEGEGEDGGAEGEDGAATLVAAPTFALRRLNLANCNLDVAGVLSVAPAPWPLEELTLSYNNFSAAAAAPALAALSRHVGLRRLDVGYCHLSAAGFKALVEASWPALTYLALARAEVAFDGPHALGAAAFAGCPALENLYLLDIALGEAGARLLAGRRWARLPGLNLRFPNLGAAGGAVLARGAWPALERLILCGSDAEVTLEDARRWAPALVELY